MCTITLSYDQNNALARRKLAALLSTGLFVEKSKQADETEKAEEEHRKEVKEFLYGSRILAAKAFARHL